MSIEKILQHVFIYKYVVKGFTLACVCLNWLTFAQVSCNFLKTLMWGKESYTLPRL